MHANPPQHARDPAGSRARPAMDARTDPLRHTHRLLPETVGATGDGRQTKQTRFLQFIE
jgi:hypothetical protein